MKERPIKNIDTEGAREDTLIMKKSPFSWLGCSGYSAVCFLPDRRVAKHLKKGNDH